MKIPRSVNGSELVKSLKVLGYYVSRQKGSHIRITTQLDGENHEVIPHHSPIKIGTLSSILKSVAMHHNISVDELIEKLEI